MKTKVFPLVAILLFAFASQAQWFRLDSISNGNLYTIHFVNADTGFTYNESATIRKTTDGGIHWDTVNIDFQGYIMDMDFASPNAGYAVGGAWFPFGQYYANAIIKTVDGGATWDSVHGNHMGGVFNSVSAPSEDEFFAVGDMGVLHSSDGGVTLDTVTVSSVQYEKYSKVQFTDASTGYILGGSYLGAGIYINTLYKTANGGLTWQPVYSDTVSAAYTRDFVMTASGNGLLTGMRGQVVRTTDGGNSWQKLQGPDTSVFLLQVTEVGGDVYAIGHNATDTSNGIYRSRDWGTTWSVEYSSSASNSWIQDMSFPTPEVGYFTTWQEVYKNDQLVSIGEQPSYAGFQLYPNPSSGHIFIELHESDEAKVGVFNSMGQKVGGQSVRGASRFQLDIGHLPAGLYLVEVRQGAIRFVERLVKE